MKLIAFIDPTHFAALFDNKVFLIELGFISYVMDEYAGEMVAKTVFGKDQILCVSDEAAVIERVIDPNRFDIFIVADEYRFDHPIAGLGPFCVLHHTRTQLAHSATLENLKVWPDFVRMRSGTEQRGDLFGVMPPHHRLARLIESRNISTANFISLIADKAVHRKC